MSKLEALLEDFKKSLERLEEVLRMEKNAVVRDSSIQRFEIAFDLAWKTLKEFLAEQHGIQCGSPKSCFREAYRQGLIEYDDFWIEITDMRNETAHSYSEKTAEKVYQVLSKIALEFRGLEKAFSNLEQL